MPTLRGALRRLKRLVAPAAPDGADPPPAPTWADDPPSPWLAPSDAERAARRWCCVCRWTGETFEGGPHSEFSTCPRCGSIGRDRFLLTCFVARSPESLGSRLLETSPRLGADYRRAMGTWFDYLCSDYDESAHKGVVRLDLQDIDEPDGRFDVILTPHVLEHVPDTDRALDEIFRVLAPGGRMYLQIPVQQGRTAPPVEPEFHGDRTPVFWRFGFDLTARLRAHGFTTTLLCLPSWREHVAAGARGWADGPISGEFDVDDMAEHAVLDDLTPLFDEDTARWHGFELGYMYLTWECLRPA